MQLAVGARATATLLHEMARRGKAARFGIVSMCIGSGMGESVMNSSIDSVVLLLAAQDVVPAGVISWIVSLSEN